MTYDFRRIPRDVVGHPEIRIIGPRSAGKSTFLAALARFPNVKSNSPIESVHPFDENAGRLISMAQDILENGLALAPTRREENINYLPTYTFLIAIKPKLSFINQKNLRFQVSCREYSGEIFKDLLNISFRDNLRAYLDDCASSSILLLIDGTSREDNLYAQALTRLQTELNEIRIARNQRLRSFRLAVVFSKAEQSQVWLHRQNVKQFVSLHFPQMQMVLEKWSKTWKCGVNYFFCSAFGMKGYPPQPNVKVETRDSSGTYGIIANPSVWQPFGLVAPIYWLYTGKDDQRLRNIEE
ncbi:hypothetical protein NUACC21_64110 [Scytonema sp. NUACC21]